MFSRLASIGLGSGRLLRAEGEGLLRRAQLSIVWAGAAFIGGVVLTVGVVAMLVAGTAWIAGQLGWVPAVAIVGAAVLIAGLVLLAVSRAALRKAVRRQSVPMQARMDSEIARMQIKGDDPMSDFKSDHTGGHNAGPNQQDDWQDKAAEFVTKNPGIVVGGAICVIAAIGPFRSLKMLSRGLMIAGLASSLKDKLGEQNGTANGTVNGTTQHAADPYAGHTRSGPAPAPGQTPDYAGAAG